MFGKRGDTPVVPSRGLEPPAAPSALPAADPVTTPLAMNPQVSPAGEAGIIPDLPITGAEQIVSPPEPHTPVVIPKASLPVEQHAVPAPAQSTGSARTDEYYDIKSTIFNALIDAIDLTQLGQLDADSARDEIRDIVNEIITLKDVVMSIAEQEELLEDICNDVLGYGPLEPLLARDDIADIMINGADRTFIETDGKMELTSIRFRDNTQLLNIAQRIVSQIGRRVDEASPICDARLPDGSRVNVIVPPLAIDGPAMTIRKFKKDRLKLKDLVNFGSITPEGGTILSIIGRVRCNCLISGGTGSGKTTLLNMLPLLLMKMNASSLVKMQPSYNCSNHMLCALKPAHPILRVRVKLPCVIW